MVTTPGTINGGFAPKSDMYSQPNVVIAVEDIAAAMQSVTGAGGSLHGEPVEIPGIGMYANFTASACYNRSRAKAKGITAHSPADAPARSPCSLTVKLESKSVVAVTLYGMPADWRCYRPA